MKCFIFHYHSLFSTTVDYPEMFAHVLIIDPPIMFQETRGLPLEVLRSKLDILRTRRQSTQQVIYCMFS
jgi:hypothetical protein